MSWQLITTSAVGGAVCASGLLLLGVAAPHAVRRLWQHARGANTWVVHRAVLALAVGIVVGVFTGWPVGGALAAAAAWWLPRLLGPDRAVLAEAERAEAVASWAQQLRDLIAGSAGLHQAIITTAETAPGLIRDDVAAVARSLRSGIPLEEAMADFAARVDAPTADLVAVALSTAEGRHAADLGALLGRLAEASRDRAHMLARTSVSRARVRSSVRIIAGAALAMVAGLTVFNRAYLAPFDTLTGQIVLLLVGATWAVGLVWLARLAAPIAQPRLLAPVDPQVREAPVAAGGGR